MNAAKEPLSIFRFDKTNKANTRKRKTLKKKRAKSKEKFFFLLVFLSRLGFFFSSFLFKQ